MKLKEINGWRIQKKIDRGGQGTVFEAVKNEAEQIRALKLIKASSIKKKNRFTQEVERHLQLSEKKAQNIIPILDHDLSVKTVEGVYGYIVMPKAESTLEKNIPLLKLRTEFCLEIFRGILNGVNEAHAVGIIHRDLKPSNILFDNRRIDNPLISDFGICYVKETKYEKRITEINETVGAKFFMAPEQARGGIVNVTEAADIYALGKLLHYMLTGRHLFRENLDEAFTNGELEHDNRLVYILDELLSKSIIESIDQRFSSINEFLEALNRIDARQLPKSAKYNKKTETQSQSETKDQINFQKSEEEITLRLYDQFSNFIANGQIRSIKLWFDKAQRKFTEDWSSLRQLIEKTPSESRSASKRLVELQTIPRSLTLALSRFDEIELFQDHKSLIEFILRTSENYDGYESVNEVPHTLAGYIFLLACSSCLHFRSWKTLRELISTKYEWFYQSKSPMYSFGASHILFFHSNAFEGKGGELHDFYMSEMVRQPTEKILNINSEEIRNLYLQTQLLLSLKVAKEIQNGNELKFWADFGRFGGYRLTTFLERIKKNREYCEGISSVYSEAPEAWQDAFNERITLLRTQRFGGPYHWSSITAYNFDDNQ